MFFGGDIHHSEDRSGDPGTNCYLSPPPPSLPCCTPPKTKSALEARLKEEGAGSLRKPEEFFVSTDFFEERETVIPPDVTVAEDEDLGGMLFHVF